MTNNLAPAVRFPGSTDDWEQRKLVEELSLLKDGTHGTHIDTENGPYLLSAKNIKNGRVNITPADRKISIEEFNKIHTNFSLQAGDVLLTIVGSIGETAVLNNADNITFQRSVAYLRPKSMNSQFLYTTISGPLFQKELKNRQVVSAQPGIYLGDLAKIDITIPDIVEQTAIASFFKQLDDTIALHQRELDNLRATKQGFLEKMFPKEGEMVPEIRFPGFTGNWEQHKLNDLALFNPKSNLPEEFEYVDLESVIGTTMVSHRTETKESAPSRAQRLAVKGDVFYQTVRPYQKNNYLFDLPYDNYVFSTGYAQLRPYGDSYFLLSRLQEERFVLNVLDRCTGTSYPAINSSDLAQIEIHVPLQYEEQVKIGKFFNQLDDTVNLHQKELEKLKQTKQAFLQKMFI